MTFINYDFNKIIIPSYKLDINLISINLLNTIDLQFLLDTLLKNSSLEMNQLLLFKMTVGKGQLITEISDEFKKIYEAVLNGRISENRINQSVERIWNMKFSMGILDGIIQPPFKELEKNIGIIDHISLAKKIAKKSITIVKDINSQLPMELDRADSLADNEAKINKFLELFST